MSRRGLTIVELLLALALLSGLAAAAVAWTTSSVASGRALQARARWETAAAATLDMLGEDLSSGDVSGRRLDRDGVPDWIVVEQDRFAIQIRFAPYSGQERVRYELDPETGVLSRSFLADGVERGRPRVLLGDVARIASRIRASIPEERRPASLNVELTARSGWTRGRVYMLEPRENP